MPKLQKHELLDKLAMLDAHIAMAKDLRLKAKLVNRLVTLRTKVQVQLRKLSSVAA